VASISIYLLGAPCAQWKIRKGNFC